jgi:hypothetical protein
LVLPPNFGSISQVKDNYAYAYHFDESRNQLLVSQLAADGTVQEMAFMSPEDNLGFYSFVLSQDGRQLIWSTSSRVEEKLHSDLWIADLDGQNEVQLIADWQDNSRVIEPIRSDGETVYFHAQWEGIGGMWNSFHGRYDSLYTVKPGGEPQKLFACEDYGLMLCLGDISPDNSVLVYTDYRANNLHLIQADGTAIATIPLSGDYSGYPTFLANGDLVFYTAVLPENENGVAAQPGTLFYLAAPYTGPAREIISGPGIMFPITAYDAEHLIINYNDEQGQWGNALLNLTDSSVAPLQPWPGTYFVALVTAD